MKGASLNQRGGAGAGYTFAASVGDALLYQFKEYARTAVDKSDLVVDASYEKVLQGLQVAAPQAGVVVLEKLLAWRGDTLADVGHSLVGVSDPSAILRKRLVVEALFLEAALRLVGGDPASLPLPQVLELERLVFDWILNADKYVDARYPDLHRLRDRVVLAASQLLGRLSPVALDSITERFLKEMALRIKAEATSSPRHELYSLCHGLRFLRLHGDTPAQLRSATNFLERVFPLKHVAPDKKSRLQQAIADMLTSVLVPLADEGDPGTFGAACDHDLRKQWFSTVTLLRTELLRWTSRQAKQVAAGLPAVTALTCLEEEGALVASIDSLVELLHRHLRDRKTSSMALLCLVRCVSCFLRRLGGRGEPDMVRRWVARSAGPAVQAMARGLLPAPEQMELVRQLCTVVAWRLPEHAIQGMVLELLAADGQQPWEAPMAGLTALMSILAEAPARLAGKLPMLDLPPTAAALEAAATTAATAAAGGTAVWVPSQDVCDQLLEIVKRGHNPLVAYGVENLAPAVSSALGRLLGQCHQLHGYSRLTNAAKPAVDLGVRERVSALSVFVAVLQCVPYAVPDTWANGAAADDLPGYTIHAEPSMRSAAVATLHRCMVSLPPMRDALVGGMATFIVRLQEEFVDVIKDSLALLLGMLREWDRLAAVETATILAAGEPAPSPSMLGSFNSIWRVEGSAMGLLCSNDVHVRQLAVDLLRTARALHRSLGAKTSGDGFGFGGAVGGTSRTSSAYDAPPMLVLPSHVRRATMGGGPQGSISANSGGGTLSGGSGGGGLLTSTTQGGQALHSPLASAAAHHSRRSTFGSASAFTPSAADLGSSIPSTPSSIGDGASAALHYLGDVIDRLGDSLARSCYWDFGQWSDIWRTWRPVPSDVSFLGCMEHVGGPDDDLRWARLLCELSREVWRRCEKSSWTGHAEVTAKLQELLVLDASGRQILPSEGLRGALARRYAMIAAAAPLVDNTMVGDKGMTSRDLVRLFISTARGGGGGDFARFALGCMDPSCHTLVVSEAAALVADDPAAGRGAPAGRSGRGSKDDARLVQAHILRVLSSNFLPGSLTRNALLKDRVMEFIVDTARYISLAVDVTPELQQLRYCLCVVARHAAVQLADVQPQAFPPMLRKQLFDKFSLYCAEGQTPGLFQSELRRHIAAAKAGMKGRDTDQLRHIESDIVDASEMLEHAAYLAMAAMLVGPLFDVDARDPGGRIFLWVDRMLASRDGAPQQPGPAGALAYPETTWGPPKDHTARTALHNVLRSAPELANVFVDRCYSPTARVAGAYFWVLAEVYAGAPLPIEPHVVVALVLNKVVDAVPSVRDAARGMLGTLARRHWSENLNLRRSTTGAAGGPSQQQTFNEGGGLNGRGISVAADGGVGGNSTVREAESSDGAVVVGSLAESHQAYQQHLSATLARDHAELAHGVTMEILSRHQGGTQSGAGVEALLCLPPWLEYASFGNRQWEAQWGGAVLRALYIVTAAQSTSRAIAAQKLWATVASNRRNIVPALDFLMRQGMAESSSSAAAASGVGGNAAALPAGGSPSACAVGKQIAVYLSRVAPRQTIDHLTHEAALQMEQQDEAGSQHARARGAAPLRSSLSPGGPYTPGGLPLPVPGRAMSPGTPADLAMIKEFHQKAAVAPIQQPLPQQQPIAAHAAAFVAAATASSSKPLTPASIAMAIKRSTVDLIVKTGVAVADTVAVAGAAAVGTISASGLTTPGGMPRGVSRPSSDIHGASLSGFDTPEKGGGQGVTAAGYYPMQYQSSDASPMSSPLAPPPPPPPRAVLTRPEVALCLLTEIACERDEELRQYLPVLLHVAVLHADSTNAQVRQEACQLMQYLLYCLACRHLEGQHASGGGGNGGVMSSDYARVSGVIGYLQSLDGEPLWEWELPTLAQPWAASAGYVAAFVQIVADCFYFDTTLRERWSAEALKWACCAASRHAASRSHQVFCALSPTLSSAACTALLAALQKCLHNATAEGLDTAVEVLCTLRVLLANTPPAKLVLYPHLLVASIALLTSSVVRLGELAAALLVQLLDALDLSSPAVQQAILSVLPIEDDDDGAGDENRMQNRTTSYGSRGAPSPTPSSSSLRNTPSREGTRRASASLWPLGFGLLSGVADVEDDESAGGPWLALPQVLIKGLFQPETEALALQGMAAIARQIASAGKRGRMRPLHNTSSQSGQALRDAYNTFNIRTNLGGGGGDPFWGSGTPLVTTSSAALALSTADGGVEAVIGSAEVGLVLSLSAALPWLCVHVGAGELADSVAAFLHDCAAAAAAIGWSKLSAILGALATGPPPAPPGVGYAAWLPDFSEVLARTFFPTYSRLVVQRLMETVQRAPERYQAAALSALRTIFEVPGLDLGSPAWFADGSHLIELLSSEVGGPLGPRVLDLLQTMAAFKDDMHGAEQWGEPMQLEWRQCMDDLGESNKVCSEALRRVVDACPGAAELAKASSGIGVVVAGGAGQREQLLPFLPAAYV